MKDVEIRAHFHHKRLRHYKMAEGVRIFDELGLIHGSCRADIAVVNGKLIGYEIKSEQDTLRRLERQIPAYEAIFDTITIIVSEKHRGAVTKLAPSHWGLIVPVRGRRGGINFRTQRKAKSNPNVDPLSVARLLWKNETIEILADIGVRGAVLRQSRAYLYEALVESMPVCVLKRTVRNYLRKRTGWRDQKQSSLNGDLSQQLSM